MSSSKVMSATEALADLQDGMQVALGGWVFSSQPMALVREVIRKGTRNLRLMPAPGSIAPDMLIAAGAASETNCVFISFEQFGLAPNFRRAAEAGAIKINEMDGPGALGALRAGACDLPFALIPDLGTDLPRVNPDFYRPYKGEPGERRMLTVPALQPDVALLHGQQADKYGNIQLYGGCFFDTMFANAAKKVIVSVDRIVDTDVICQNARLTKIPAACVDAVVEVPYGAHPTSSAGLYDLDEAHIKAYAKASRTVEGIAAYLDEHVHRTVSEADYLRMAGGNPDAPIQFPV